MPFHPYFFLCFPFLCGRTIYTVHFLQREQEVYETFATVFSGGRCDVCALVRGSPVTNRPADRVDVRKCARLFERTFPLNGEDVSSFADDEPYAIGSGIDACSFPDPYTFPDVCKGFIVSVCVLVPGQPRILVPGQPRIFIETCL